MACDVYFPEDIRRVLIALASEVEVAPLAGGDYAVGYRDGHRQALHAAALAFGIVLVDQELTTIVMVSEKADIDISRND